MFVYRGKTRLLDRTTNSQNDNPLRDEDTYRNLHRIFYGRSRQTAATPPTPLLATHSLSRPQAEMMLSGVVQSRLRTYHEQNEARLAIGW